MRKILLVLPAPLILVIAAAIIIPFAVPSQVYEGRLIALVKQATGRDLRIAGPVKLSVLPNVAIVANDVSFANEQGAHAPEMARLKRLRILLQLWPLVRGRVIVNRLVLDHPAIALEVDKAGHPNWAFGRATPPASTTARGVTKPAATASGFGISGVVLKKLQLIDGTVSYLDRRSGKTERLDDVNVTLTQRRFSSPVAAGGSAVWDGERVSLTLNVVEPGPLLNGAESEVDVRFVAAPLTLDFRGRASGPPTPRLTGALVLEAGSARALARWAGWPIPSDIAGFGPLAIKGTLAMAGTKARLADADFSLDAIKATGSLSIDGAAARPLVTGRLAINRLDLDPYLAPPRTSTAPPAARGAASPATQGGPSGRATGASPLALADVDLDLGLGGIAYHRFQFGASDIGLHVKDGRLTADLRRIALYQGSGRGQVTMDGNGATPSVGLDLDLGRVQIAPLAQAATGSSRLTGILNLDMAVTARGRSGRDLIATLSGRGRLSLVNGQIAGVDLLGLAESATKIERDLIGTLDVTGQLNLLVHGQINGVDPLALAVDAAKGVVGRGKSTGFGTLTASGIANNGIVRNNDLRVSSGIVQATGAGIVDLRTRVVNYRLNLRGPQGVTVPVQVTGTWDEPVFRPDMAAMLAQTPANARAILGGSVDRNLEGLKSLGKGALGGLKSLFGK